MPQPCRVACPDRGCLFHKELYFHIYCCKCFKATRIWRVLFLTQLESRLSWMEWVWGAPSLRSEPFLSILQFPQLLEAKNAEPRPSRCRNRLLIKPWLNFPSQNKVSHKVSKIRCIWEKQSFICSTKKRFLDLIVTCSAPYKGCWLQDRVV